MKYNEQIHSGDRRLVELGFAPLLSIPVSGKGGVLFKLMAPPGKPRRYAPSSRLARRAGVRKQAASYFSDSLLNFPGVP